MRVDGRIPVMVVVAALLLLVVAGIGYAIVQTTTTKTPGASRPDGAGVTTTQIVPGRCGSVPGALERRHGGRLPAGVVCPGDVRRR